MFYILQQLTTLCECKVSCSSCRCSLVLLLMSWCNHTCNCLQTHPPHSHEVTKQLDKSHQKSRQPEWKKKLWSTSLIQLYHSFLSPNTMCWTNTVPTSDSCWGMHRFRCSKRSCQTPPKCNNSNKGKMLKQNKFYQLKECTQPIRITFQQRKGKCVKMIGPRQPLKEYKVKLNYGYQVLCSLAQARWLL